MNQTTWPELDSKYIWHPYSAFAPELAAFPVVSASGVRLKLSDGRELIDGMSSWWCAIHGYNHPVLNQAITEQLKSMAHVMFGGLTHQPAAELAELLVTVTPQPLETVFFSDSGSVAVEVALKMAIQYWQSQGVTNKQRFLTIRGGYHGDTLGAMSVCDPETGMHTLFDNIISQQLFAASPRCEFGQACTAEDIEPLEKQLEQHHADIAAIILEPVVQGAGGMRFYSAEYLQQVRKLCDTYNVLLILDEIATGFGRTGKLFASEHANISPDIMCVGKALTGGYLTLAATLTTTKISQTISDAKPGIFMHGPTFMANPLACAVALASLRLLLSSAWRMQVSAIETQLKQGLSACASLSVVADVRVLGAIGVVELKQPVTMETIQPMFVNEGVWIRPFGKCIYLMPPFIITPDDLKRLTDAVLIITRSIENTSLSP